MNDQYSLRPEDFRKAWTNAYRTAVLQLGEMHRRADKQLAVSQNLMDFSEQKSDELRVRLHQTGTVFLKKLEEAGDRCMVRLERATSILEDRTNKLVDSEIRRRQQMEEILGLIQSERQRLAMMQSVFFNLPWWSRLWNHSKIVAAFKRKASR